MSRITYEDHLLLNDDEETWFWDKIELPPQGSLSTDCWTINCAANEWGYVQLLLRGRKVYAHRIMALGIYERWIDQVRHTCNSKNCVSPFHLLPGDQQSNAEDRKLAGGYANVGGKRLTSDRRKQIVHLRTEGVGNVQIASLVGCSINTVKNVMRKEAA